MKPHRSPLLAAFLSVAVAGTAQAQARAPQADPAPQRPPLRIALSDEVVRQAVKETLAAEEKAAEQDRGRALSGDRYENFSRQFDEAKVPGCLRPDGLKNQPTYIFGGLLAAPFVAIAALRGKCN
ncbi:hypothetical protein [Massilia terrae]|uniref:Secreted protein n=1 Tax=Massilia terrae TaxID=1811224 RepID=A0ABT2CV76_9BURK|nr:hypothetical protein [Massilia terrae]MCS0657883.1 hypothetical protein [Massilia terrae]